MAKPAWSTTIPDYGSGDATISVTAQTNTGRNTRSGAATVKAAGVTDKPVTYNNTGKPEFVEIDNVSAPKSGGNVTLTGKSNSAKLSFALGSGDIAITLPGTFLAGGVSTNNNVNIAGDPGATGEYTFTMTISIPENASTGTKTRIVTVTANGGQSASATITQAAGDPYVIVTPNVITIDWTGAAQTFTIESNTNWTIE